MNERTRAEEHLRVIRSLMERATVYRAISAPTALIGGLLALASCLTIWLLDRSHAAAGAPGFDPRHFAAIWLTNLAIVLTVNAFFLRLEAVKAGRVLLSPGARLTIRAATATFVGPTAVTVFDVTPRFGSPPDWDRLRADVRRAYDDALPLAAHLAERERTYSQSESAHVVPPAVLWDDAASATASVVEVRAHDSVGLLHRLTRALADLELDVRSARVSTLGAEVVDAFYVVEANGRPVENVERRLQVEQALLTACRPAS